MRVAIAGSRSVLGQALRRRCAAANWETISVDRGEADIQFDLLAPDPHALQALAGANSLVICAATFADEGIAGMREALQGNVLGVLALLEGAVRAGVAHLVFVSSTSAIEARGAYGLSKATAEAVLSRLCAINEVRLTILRPGQMYDTEGSAAKHQPLLYFMIDRVAAGEDVTLFGQSDVLRNYVHVEDVAEALFRCVGDRAQGVFNVVHPISLKISEVAEAIRRAFDTPVSVAFDPVRPDMPQIAIPSDANLFKHLGFEPRAFDEGLAEIRAMREAATA